MDGSYWSRGNQNSNLTRKGAVLRRDGAARHTRAGARDAASFSGGNVARTGVAAGAAASPKEGGVTIRLVGVRDAFEERSNRNNSGSSRENSCSDNNRRGTIGG